MLKPMSDRIMTMILPLMTRNCNATIISVYAVTITNPEETKEVFYNQLAHMLRNTPRTDKLILIDYIITRQQDKMDIPPAHRAMLGANCWTDHQLLRSKIDFVIRPKHNRQGTNTPFKLDTEKLQTDMYRERLEQGDGKGTRPMGGTRKFVA